MVFSSVIFISFFLPAVFLLHQILPGIRLKNGMLLMASLLFYAYGEPVYVFLMIGTAFANYLSSIALGKRRSRVLLAAVIVMNLTLLGIFKYAGFLAETVNLIPGVHLPVPQVTLPIGISFYTFQAMSYVIDVYRGMTPPEKRFSRVLLYISCFPQLIAGPIVKYHEIDRELSSRHASMQDIHDGIRILTAGLSKKVLIANTMAAAADAVFSAPHAQMGPLTAWIGALAYLFQIYFDFSGYSDMAIGMGRMFGFHFPVNFAHPYTAGSMRDFWKRWHISLTDWFRTYLYIPLGGNRKGKMRTILNRFLVFACTGIWHGANLTFLLWGLYHGLLMMLEEAAAGLKKSARRTEGERPGSAGRGGRGPAAIRKGAAFIGQAAGRIGMHIYTLLAVTIGFVLFRAESAEDGLFRIRCMFMGIDRNGASLSLGLAQLTPLFLTAFAAAVICLRPVPSRLKNMRGYETAADVLSAAGLLLCLLSLAGGAYNPFIYFRF